MNEKLEVQNIFVGNEQRLAIASALIGSPGSLFWTS